MADAKEETESPILTSIRNYMMRNNGLGGTENKEYDVAMNVDKSSGAAKGYSAGGVIRDDDMPDMGMPPIPPSSFDVGNQSGTYATAGNIPPPPPPAVMPQPPPLPPPPMPPAPMAPPTRPAPVLPPSVPPPAAPQGPASLSDVIAQGQSAGAQMSGPYTPDKRAQLYSYLAQQQNDMPHAIGNSLASVGDAITRGYGRSQSNFQNDTLGAEQKNREEALGAFDKGAEMTKEQTQTGMGLETTDPTSASSKMAQESHEPLLSNLGYSKDQISHMAASQIAVLTQTAVTYGGKKMELLGKQAELNLERLKAGEDMRHNVANEHTALLGEENAQQGREVEKAKAVLGSGSPWNPFNQTTKADVAKAHQTLSGGGTPAQGLAAGEVVRHTSDGKQAVFDSNTKQFKRFM
jgi:hypothetical protein